MKTVYFALSILFFASCDILSEAVNTVNLNSNTEETPNPLTNEEVIGGLKEALNVGIKNSVDLTSIADGFYKNAAIKLPFPEDAIKVKEKALDLGLEGQVEKFELTLNRAAEEATKEAVPIFVDAIKNMTVSDGFAILNGGDGAATSYLKSSTNDKLTTAFSPVVENAISKVKITDYWNPIINKYNGIMTLTGGEKLNPDLNAYITKKAIDGLFYMVAIEENKIRENPVAQVTDLLKRVFGSLLN